MAQQGIPVAEARRIIEAGVRAEGECRVWQGFIDSRGYPRLPGGRQLRRLALAARLGRRLPSSTVAVQTCETTGCLEHLVSRSRADVARESRRGGPGAP